MTSNDINDLYYGGAPSSVQVSRVQMCKDENCPITDDHYHMDQPLVEERNVIFEQNNDAARIKRLQDLAQAAHNYIHKKQAGSLGMFYYLYGLSMNAGDFAVYR